MAPEGHLNRAPSFVVELAVRESARHEPVSGGVAVLSTDLWGSHEQNRLLLTEPVPWDVAVAEADRVLGGAGLAHRRVEWLCGRPSEVGGEGWEVTSNVFMYLDGELDPAFVGDAAAAEVVPFEQVRQALWDDWRVTLPSSSDEIIDHLVDRRRRTARACDLTWHAVMRDGMAAASCDLRVLDVGAVRMAQIEDVLTLQAFRGKGFARAVVSHAIATAQQAGAEVIWLEAERDDWPRELYSRMGFVVHGPEVTVATRMR